MGEMMVRLLIEVKKGFLPHDGERQLSTACGGHSLKLTMPKQKTA